MKKARALPTGHRLRKSSVQSALAQKAFLHAVESVNMESSGDRGQIQRHQHLYRGWFPPPVPGARVSQEQNLEKITGCSFSLRAYETWPKVISVLILALGTHVLNKEPPRPPGCLTSRSDVPGREGTFSGPPCGRTCDPAPRELYHQSPGQKAGCRRSFVPGRDELIFNRLPSRKPIAS